MTDTSKRQFVPALHGLRGLMALWIVAYHTSPSGFGAIRVSNYGYLAVDVFFILSGYVLMHSHGWQFGRVTWKATAAFWRLRWWRVYPLCLLSVAASVVLFRALRGDWPGLARVGESLLVLDQWARPGIGLNAPAWSLGVEVLGYLAFPLVACCLPRLNRSQGALALGGLLVVATAAFALNGDTWDNAFGLPAVARMAAGFGAGCLLFILQPGRLQAYGDLLIAAAAAGLTAILLAGQPLLVLPFLILLVYGAAISQGRGAALLGSRPLLFLGRISFALYITHYLVLGAVVAAVGHRPASLADKLASTAAVVVISLGLAWLLCVLVEEPLRRRGRRRTVARPAADANTPDCPPHVPA